MGKTEIRQTMEPAISVIIPMYKVEPYIEVCVNSVLGQTFQDYEILLIDDASPDKTGELCKELYGKLPNVRYVRKENNSGLGPTRNLGIEQARGKYILFLDGDDAILPSSLELLYQSAEASNADIVHTVGFFCPAIGEFHICTDNPVMITDLSPVSRPTLLDSHPAIRAEEYSSKKAHCSVCNKLFRRMFLIEKHLKFQPMLGEDLLFHFKALMQADIYLKIPDVFYVYRIHDGSLSHRFLNPELYRQAVHAILHGTDIFESYMQEIPFLCQNSEMRDSLRTFFIDNLDASFMKAFYQDNHLPNYANDIFVKTFQEEYGKGGIACRHFFHAYHRLKNENTVQMLENENLMLRIKLQNLQSKM